MTLVGERIRPAQALQPTRSAFGSQGTHPLDQTASIRSRGRREDYSSLRPINKQGQRIPPIQHIDESLQASLSPSQAGRRTRTEPNQHHHVGPRTPRRRRRSGLETNLHQTVIRTPRRVCHFDLGRDGIRSGRRGVIVRKIVQQLLEPHRIGRGKLTFLKGLADLGIAGVARLQREGGPGRGRRRLEGNLPGGLCPRARRGSLSLNGRGGRGGRGGRTGLGLLSQLGGRAGRRSD